MSTPEPLDRLNSEDRAVADEMINAMLDRIAPGLAASNESTIVKLWRLLETNPLAAAGMRAALEAKYQQIFDAEFKNITDNY